MGDAFPLDDARSLAFEVWHNPVIGRLALSQDPSSGTVEARRTMSAMVTMISALLRRRLRRLDRLLDPVRLASVILAGGRREHRAGGQGERRAGHQRR